MERKEIDFLVSDQARESIEKSINRTPFEVALDRSITNASIVATQVKYLQRAKQKLPSYYAVRAILPSLAFEQSSSEECATCKKFAGKLALDLTCGLGVDSLYLSKKFDKVISVEKDERLAEIARINFQRLGAVNIEVICSSAEDFLSSVTEKFDLIYIDPDRRSEKGKKLVRLEECSPNVIELMPILMSLCEILVVKNSPLFDIHEAFRLFGDHTKVDVISLRGECKEVLVTVDKSIETPVLCATVVGKSEYQREYQREFRHSLDGEKRATFNPENDYKFITIPDVALRKAELTEGYFEQYNDVEVFGGYGFSLNRNENLLGKTFSIKSVLLYQPKVIKKLLDKRIEIVRHSFPYSTEQICRSLGVKEGGVDRWIFVEIDSKLWAIQIGE